MWSKFWAWYEKYRAANTLVAALLFIWQLIHLYWLSAHVLAFKISGASFFNPSGLWETLLVLVDYTEIPAIVATSLVYINNLRQNHKSRDVWFLILLNSQWLHLFWITDEFVLEHFLSHTGPNLLPVWLAWIAIFIDYLELPVIYDTIKTALRNLLRIDGAPVSSKID